jgi:hypothetical protein
MKVFTLRPNGGIVVARTDSGYGALTVHHHHRKPASGARNGPRLLRGHPSPIPNRQSQSFAGRSAVRGSRRGYRAVLSLATLTVAAVLIGCVWEPQRPATAPPPPPAGAASPPTEDATRSLPRGPPTEVEPAPAMFPSAESPLPKFPWPPAAPSASVVIPNEVLLRIWTSDAMPPASEGVSAPASIGRYSSAMLRSEWASGGARWMHVDAALSDALARAGYSESSYFAVPKGFVLVTRLEHINPDGTPLAGLGRWQSDTSPMTNFSLSQYVRALFEAPAGLYRIIAFVVSAEPFVPTSTALTESEATAWLTQGENVLPVAIGEHSYTPDFVCTALVYEFAKHDVQSDATVRRPGSISGAVHLQASGIRSALR